MVGIFIDGEKQEPDNIVIRFCKGEPYIFRNGKRVVKAFDIQIAWSEPPEKPEYRNANTE